MRKTVVLAAILPLIFAKAPLVVADIAVATLTRIQHQDEVETIFKAICEAEAKIDDQQVKNVLKNPTFPNTTVKRPLPGPNFLDLNPVPFAIPGMGPVEVTPIGIWKDLVIIPVKREVNYQYFVEADNPHNRFTAFAIGDFNGNGITTVVQMVGHLKDMPLIGSNPVNPLTKWSFGRVWCEAPFALRPEE